jgi:hypothetical protein
MADVTRRGVGFGACGWMEAKRRAVRVITRKQKKFNHHHPHPPALPAAVTRSFYTYLSLLQPLQRPFFNGRDLGGLGRRGGGGGGGGGRRVVLAFLATTTTGTATGTTAARIHSVGPARRRQRARARTTTTAPTTTPPTGVDGGHQARPPRKLAVILQQQAPGLLIECGFSKGFNQQAAHDDEDVAQAQVGLWEKKGCMRERKRGEREGKTRRRADTHSFYLTFQSFLRTFTHTSPTPDTFGWNSFVRKVPLGGAAGKSGPRSRRRRKVPPS